MFFIGKAESKASRYTVEGFLFYKKTHMKHKRATFWTYLSSNHQNRRNLSPQNWGHNKQCQKSFFWLELLTNMIFQQKLNGSSYHNNNAIWSERILFFQKDSWKTLLEICSPQIYTSFNTFCVQIDQSKQSQCVFKYSQEPGIFLRKYRIFNCKVFFKDSFCHG